MSTKLKPNIPKVELRLSRNFPFVSLIIRLDFPTAASPASTTLNIRSGSLLNLAVDWNISGGAMKRQHYREHEKLYQRNSFNNFKIILL